MIEFADVAKTFRGPDGAEVRALQDLTLVVERGETHVLIGASGCGKTTALRMVNRLEDADRGVVRVDGRDVAEQDVYELRARIGYVIQSGGLFPHETIEKNVGIRCELAAWDVERRRARVRELLELVQLGEPGLATRYPHELSGGQRQRIGVARALANEPEILLMDEAFGALDPITRRELQDDFERVARDLAMTVLFVTHDIDEAFRLGDKITILRDGRVVQTGTADQLRREPADEWVRDFVQGARPR